MDPSHLPQPRKVQHAPAALEQSVLGDGARVAGVVRRAARDPDCLLRDLPDAGAAELDEAGVVGVVLVGVAVEVGLHEEVCLGGGGEGKVMRT